MCDPCGDAIRQQNVEMLAPSVAKLGFVVGFAHVLEGFPA